MTTATYITTEPSEIERAAALLFARRGARAPIEIVRREIAYLHPAHRPVIRLAGIGGPGTSRAVGGGRHSRTGGLTTGSVLVGFYGTDQVDLVGMLVQRHLTVVDERHRELADDWDLYELVIRRGGSGVAGPLALPYTSVTLDLGILPPVPVLGSGEVHVRSFATSIVGDLRLRNRGELVIDAELVDVTSTDSPPDENGEVQRSVVVTARAWPMARSNGPKATGGYVWERAQTVLQGLSGRGFPQAGRITAVEVLEHTPSGGAGVEVKVNLTLAGRIGGAK